ncbi:MAG: KamA family radical SAM protein [Thiolinea sp.]
MGHFPDKITATIRNKLHHKAVAIQFVAQRERLAETAAAGDLPGFSYDAVADQEYRVGRGMIRKYRNRLLLIAHARCAVHCRYCFRQHFDYREETFQDNDLAGLEQYLRDHPEIDEVILSGGDPLMLSNQRLNSILTMLSGITTIKRIRIHSRMFSVQGKRINTGLMEIFHKFRRQLVLVSHVNHPQELDHETDRTFAKLRQAGLILLNQSVLLKGVNDDPLVLKALSERLFGAGVMPYYLNLLDRVKGAEDFYLSDREAMAIYREMARQTSGYLLPKLVRDKGNADYKSIIGLDDDDAAIAF